MHIVYSVIGLLVLSGLPASRLCGCTENKRRNIVIDSLWGLYLMVATIIVTGGIIGFNANQKVFMNFFPNFFDCISKETIGIALFVFYTGALLWEPTAMKLPWIAPAVAVFSYAVMTVAIGFATLVVAISLWSFFFMQYNEAKRWHTR